MKMFRFQALSLSVAAGAVSTTKNMNGRYSVASGGHQDVPFNDDYASKGHEYFDWYSEEIATHYGEVWWSEVGNTPLPDEIVERFKGKVLAMTGYEVDQVMVTPTGQPGVNPEKDVSVPYNWAYNHHYTAHLGGKHSYFQEEPCGPTDIHCEGTHLVAHDSPSAALRKDPSIPTHQFISEGNGGEARKSFHGYPNGYAQLVDGPTHMELTPMQIDTRNRDCGVRPEDINNCSTFIPGPEPKQSRYGRGIPEGTDYSGLLECPCNERFGGDPIWYPDAGSKIITHNYVVRATGSCTDDVGSASACFEAVPTLGINATHFANKTVSDPKLPPACSVEVESDGSATVYYNSAGEASCDGGKLVGSTTSDVNVTLSLQLELSKGGGFNHSDAGVYCGDNHHYIKQFNMDPDVKKSNQTAALVGARDQCEAFCLEEDTCWGCSVDCHNPATLDCAWNALQSCGDWKSWAGGISGDITQKQRGLATITMSGPADVWFAVGLDADAMVDQPYALIVNDTRIIEMRLGDCTDEGKHCGGPILERSIKLVSNTEESGVRTVVFTRAMVGLTKDHYTFDPTVNTMSLISAVGNTQTFAYHRAHAQGQISLASIGAPSCICDMGATGKICETGGVHCNQFEQHGRCVDDGPLTAQHNPTCTSAQYAGGLKCCGHKRILLDVDQAQESLQRDVLRYHFKFRIWFQEYVPASESKNGVPSHYDLPRVYYQTEAHATEYDVPPAFPLPDLPIPGYEDWPVDQMTPGTSCTGDCPNGDDCHCIHTIQYEWSIPGTRLLYAGGHCHAPACISLNLYVNNSGTLELLCEQVPKYGKGDVAHDKFDDKGYITLPPCLWSDDPSEGLQPPTWLPDGTHLVSIKKNNNTHMGHYGDMASWQMRGVHWETPPTTLLI